MDVSIIHVDDLPDRIEADVAVVIDVIRAFTVAPWCLARGADEMLLAPSIDAAVAVAAQHPEALLLKDGPPDPRFALPNAPGRIAREDLTGRTVVQKTGNGTRGAHAVAAADVVLCASFVTGTATARVLRRLKPARLLLVPTEGDEDQACAEWLVGLLDGPIDPTPYLARVARSRAADELRERGPDPAFPGVDPDDLDRCLDVDRFDFALRAVPSGDQLRLERV